MELLLKSRSGPLPDPEDYAAYEHVLPGSAERILAMAEKQAEHRQAQEDHERGDEARAEARGSYLGFGAVVVIALLAAFLAGQGYSTAAGVIGTADIVGLAAVFIAGRRRAPG